jgi:hypothetical protein
MSAYERHVRDSSIKAFERDGLTVMIDVRAAEAA